MLQTGTRRLARERLVKGVFQTFNGELLSNSLGCPVSATALPLELATTQSMIGHYELNGVRAQFSFIL